MDGSDVSQFNDQVAVLLERFNDVKFVDCTSDGEAYLAYYTDRIDPDKISRDAPIEPVFSALKPYLATDGRYILVNENNVALSSNRKGEETISLTFAFGMRDLPREPLPNHNIDVLPVTRVKPVI